MLRSFLEGVRVLDLSQYLPGPFATRLLADMGAEVVKVEPPAGDPLRNLDPEGKEGSSPFYDIINAGKTVMTVDLKSAAGREALDELVKRADVLLESFRPDALHRLGFGPERLGGLNPRLIHCALSGFGQTGPLRLASGHDLGYEALTGNISVTGTREQPVIPFPPMADHAGAMQAVVTILGALLARQGGHREGAFLDISLSESLMSWQAPALTLPPRRAEGAINGGAACYQIYRTADDRFVTISPLEPKFWANFCNAVGHPEWIPRQLDPLPQTELIHLVAEFFASQPLAHWEALLTDADCCYQAVLSCDEVPDHPHVKARGLVRRHERFTEVLFPAYVDERPPEERAAIRWSDAAAVLAAWGDG